MRTLLRVAIAIVLLAVVAWWSLALRFRLPDGNRHRGRDRLPGRRRRGPAVAAAVRARRARDASRRSRSCWPAGGARIRPSNDRDWAPRVRERPVRRARRRPAGAAQRAQLRLPHRDRLHPALGDADLRSLPLTELDLFMSYWGSPWIAHTILSWAFADGPPLAISIETRRDAHRGVLGAARVLSRVRDLLRGGGRARSGPAAHQLPGRGRLPLSAADATRARAGAPARLREEHERAARPAGAGTTRSPTTARRASAHTRRRSVASRRSTGACSPTATPTRCCTSAAALDTRVPFAAAEAACLHRPTRRRRRTRIRPSRSASATGVRGRDRGRRRLR